MKLYGNLGIGNLLKIFLEVCMGIIILTILFLPKIVELLGLHFDLFIISIYPCGIGFLTLIYQFVKLFETLKENNPFYKLNVIRLKRSMIISFIISFFVFIALLLSIFKYNYYSLQLQYCIFFISILFCGVGIALYILSELFKLAINYKEENELTI